MNTQRNFPALLVGALAAVLLSGCATTTTVTKKWSYNNLIVAGPQDSGSGKAYSRNTLTLTRPSATSPTGSVTIAGAIVDPCLTGGVDTKVEYTPEAIVLLPIGNFATCPLYRITIRNDGTGGSIERKPYKSNTWAIWADEPGLLPR